MGTFQSKEERFITLSKIYLGTKNCTDSSSVHNFSINIRKNKKIDLTIFNAGGLLFIVSFFG